MTDHFEALCLRIELEATEHQARLLRKLKVAELRVLARHFKIHSADYLPKENLVEEIAPIMAESF